MRHSARGVGPIPSSFFLFLLLLFPCATPISCYYESSRQFPHICSLAYLGGVYQHPHYTSKEMKQGKIKWHDTQHTGSADARDLNSPSRIQRPLTFTTQSPLTDFQGPQPPSPTVLPPDSHHNLLSSQSPDPLSISYTV